MKYLSVPFFFLVALFAFTTPIHAATHLGSKTSVGPFAFSGILKIYFQTLSAGKENWLDITAASGQYRVIMPACENGNACPILSAKTIPVNEGETITVYFHGLNKTAQGWTDRTSKWTCGQGAKKQGNDGQISFQNLETRAEAENMSIPDAIQARQCWEDLTVDSDNDWNDVVLIYTYEAGSIAAPEKMFFMGTKLGPRPTMIDSDITMDLCPIGIQENVFISPSPCLVRWATDSAKTRSTPLFDQFLFFITTFLNL
jgi:hypothetical protein